MDESESENGLGWRDWVNERDLVGGRNLLVVARDGGIGLEVGMDFGVGGVGLELMVSGRLDGHLRVGDLPSLQHPSAMTRGWVVYLEYRTAAYGILRSTAE